MEGMPIVTLVNGLRVANFSSPHTFTFEDGTVLPACSPERAKALLLNSDEEERYREIRGCQVVDIRLKFSMSDAVQAALGAAEKSDADIVLVPFPVLEAMKSREEGFDNNSKFRVVRSADRVTKTICANRFCV